MPLKFDCLPEAIFLDRDGTLIEHVHYLSDPEEVQIIEGVAETLKEAKKWGCLLFLHTNQSGVGRGYFTMNEVVECNDRMYSLLGLGDDVFDAVCIATESPDDKQVYRKPSPKFAYEMRDRFGLRLENCVMIGDRETDVQTAVNAGMQSVGIWRMGENEERRSNFENAEAAIHPSVAVYWQQLKTANGLD